MIKRCMTSFLISSMCGLIVNLLIEAIVRRVSGMTDFVPFAAEYLAKFPSDTIAVEVAILLYGVIGAAFAGMAFIYEENRIGFLVQNLIYFAGTSLVWVPIVTLIWQLHKHAQSLIGTLIGFAATYLIMSIVGYRITKEDVRQINRLLQQQSE